MKVQLRSASVRLFVLSLFASFAAGTALSAPTPPAGLYENSTGAPIVALLDSAQHSIDIEIYTMGDPVVRKAILNALADRVKVRIIQEPTPVGSSCKIFGIGSAPNPSAAPDEPGSPDDLACAELKAFRNQVLKAGGTYVPFNKILCGAGSGGATPGCVEHGKMIIVDGKAALLSTGNFDSTNLCNAKENPERCNRDYDYIIHYAPAIQILGQIFEQDLRGKPYNLKALLGRAGARDLTVSPFSLPPLVQFIRSAKRSIRLQEQYLKEPTINAELLAAAKRGVQLYLNVASACAFGTPRESDAAKWTQTYKTFEEAGAKIRAFTSEMRVGNRPGYLHAKAIVVDDQTAWVGSTNGSSLSVSSNREFGVFFDGARDMNLLLRFMKADFANPHGESWQESLQCKRDRV
ncbi:MAG: phosphatidylserine/phosphatidylglycerophosphate/cardiolipin synthase family protein [Bdellovibrionales bacterium]|nr:phosphatidylserine/phosphatidylglycerophosphate/cardiolipin synthase family protein [Bdellovibrionales bacterium]